jgi:hypothetical protein
MGERERGVEGGSLPLGSKRRSGKKPEGKKNAEKIGRRKAELHGKTPAPGYRMECGCGCGCECECEYGR